jgi:hypothetical protein
LLRSYYCGDGGPSLTPEHDRIIQARDRAEWRKGITLDRPSGMTSREYDHI